MDREKKMLRMMQLQTVLLACILVLLLAAGVFLVGELANLGELMQLVEQQLQALDLDAVNEAVAAMAAAGEELSAVDVKALNGAVAALKDAAGNLSDVDMQALNEAVTALKGAAEGMQDLDFKALSDLIQSLETVSSRLERVTKIFG